MSYNYPSYIIHTGNERKDHKYVARVPLGVKNGKTSWRYFYTNEEWQAYKSGNKTGTNVDTSKVKDTDKNVLDSLRSGIKSMSDSSKDKVDTFFKNVGVGLEKELYKTTGRLDKIVNTTKKVASEIYDDKNNVYDVNTSNYDEKIKKIAETPEWKAIVARKDPEYIRKNSDGTNTYLIDDYLVKKKKPVLDVVDDIVNNRPITINKIEKDAMVASLKEQVFGKISLGVLAVNVVSKALLEKSKLFQGTYNDEVKDMKTTIEAGKDYVSKTVDAAKESASTGQVTITDEDVADVVKYLENTNLANTIKDAKKAVDEEKVIQAAKIIMASDSIPTNVKESDYFKLTEASLSNLSEEEIVMLNILITSAMKGKS